MKQLIKGVMYNTDMSRMIGVRCGEIQNGQLIAETLYKTKEGHYFLCESDILKRNTSVKITPVQANDAEAWAKINLGEYVYAAEFGKTLPENSNTPKILSISLPQDLIKKLQQKQTEQGKNMSQIIESILRKEL